MNGILFDENIPLNFKIKTSLSIITTKALAESPTDSQIWEYAKKKNFIIVTKDADFYYRIITSEPPPKVVHLKIGNMRKSEFHFFLTKIWSKVEGLLQNNKLVRVYPNHIDAL